MLVINIYIYIMIPVIINSQCYSIKWIEQSTKYVLPRIHVCMYIYILEVGSKLHFHPDKPVSWSLTLQGILMIRIFMTIDYILWDYIVGENLNLNV